MLKILFIYLLFTTPIFSRSIDIDLSHVSFPELPQTYTKNQKKFQNILSQSVSKINKNLSVPLTALAPMSGSKISPFLEIKVDKLIMIDWQAPGTPKEVFANIEDKEKRRYFFYTTFRGGSMSSSDLMKSTLLAQILFRLKLELGVDKTRVDFDTSKNLHKRILTEEEGLIKTRISFFHQNKLKEILLLSYRISSDLKSRETLPWQELDQHKIHWLYLSAEGVGFFSSRENGLNQTSQRLEDVIEPQGAIVLDYPHHKTYTQCSQKFDEMIFMCPRGKPSSLFENVFTHNAKEPFIGYIGHHPDDQIKIFQKAL